MTSSIVLSNPEVSSAPSKKTGAKATGNEQGKDGHNSKIRIRNLVYLEPVATPNFTLKFNVASLLLKVTTSNFVGNWKVTSLLHEQNPFRSPFTGGIVLLNNFWLVGFGSFQVKGFVRRIKLSLQKHTWMMQKDMIPLGVTIMRRVAIAVLKKKKNVISVIYIEIHTTACAAR